MRLFYKDLDIGQKVKVQAFYGELTECFYSGEITNMDGQNIVVKVEERDFTNDVHGMKQRDHEACNPEYAVVTDMQKNEKETEGNTDAIKFSPDMFHCHHCGAPWEDELSRMTCPCLDMP